MIETIPKEAVNRVAVLIFFVLLTVALLINLGVRPLDFEEPRRAVVAIEMELNGDYLVPFTNAQHYYNKPPLWNWVLIGVTKMFGGKSEFVYRLPTVVSFLLIGFLLFRVSSKYLSRETVLLATGLSLTFANQLFNATLNAEIDVFYSFLVFAQGCAIFYFERRERYLPLFLVSYFFAAAGFLTKGIPSIAFQGITLVAWLIAERKFRLLFSWYHLCGLLLFVAFVGGYFYAYSLRADPWPYLFKLFLETGDRTVAGGFSFTGLLLHVARFPIDVLQLLLPWSILIPLMFVRGVLSTTFKNDWVRFAAIFIAFNFIPYWISPGTRERYLYMFLPFAAVILASLVINTPKENRYKRFTEILFMICFVAAIGLFATLPFTDYSRFIPYSFVTCSVLAVGILLTAIWYWRTSGKSLVGVLLLLAFIRMGYDFFVPYVRAQQSVATYYKGMAQAVGEQFGDTKYIIGEFTLIEGKIPVIDKKVLIRDQEYFPFSLPYYYYLSTGRHLVFTNTMEPGTNYLAAEDYVVTRPHEVLRVFDEGDINLKGKPRMKLFRVVE